jgi:hypothetical protein
MISSRRLPGGSSLYGQEGGGATKAYFRLIGSENGGRLNQSMNIVGDFTVCGRR